MNMASNEVSNNEVSNNEVPNIEDHSTITAFVCLKDAKAAMAFYQTAFGAGVKMEPLVMGDGRIGYAELSIGNSSFSISDEFPEMDVLSPATLGGSPIMLSLIVADVDAFVARAVEAGAKIVKPVEDQFHGDRSGQIMDPFGYRWMISTPIETVSDEEMRRRAKELFG